MASYTINPRKAVRINNFEGSRFDLFYEKGVGTKLSNGNLNVQIFKKGGIEDYSSYDYEQKMWKRSPNKDVLVAISSNSQSILSFDDFSILQNLIDKVKTLLETENELNNIQKPKTLKNSEIVTGGIYEQEDGTKVLFLGSGEYFSNRHYDGKVPCNRQASPKVLAWIRDENTVTYNSETNTLQFSAVDIDSRVGLPKFVKCIKEFDLKDHHSLSFVNVTSWGSSEYFMMFNNENKFKPQTENTDEVEM